MSILGNFGSFYMFVLIILLIIGLGMIGTKLAGYILESVNKSERIVNNNFNNKNNGGIFMNSWLRLALFSFVGIIVSMAVLSFISSGGFITGLQNDNMQAHGSMTNGNSSMYMQNGNMPMNNMQMSSGSTGGMNMMPMGNMGGMSSGGMG
ncbi:MAG: hypothetical protein ACOZCL_13420, partial [Bacillota bacterium]